MSSQFQYLLDRIQEADFVLDPFPHLYLPDFLSDVHFKAITSSAEVDLPPAKDVDELFVLLEAAGYAGIEFPGCTSSRTKYLRWLEKASRPRSTHRACEGQGMALRCEHPANDDVGSLDEFFRSPELVAIVRTKFGVSQPTRTEAGLQKYLHGYEISPHPDIRQKALTWMLNVNPSVDSELLDIHTHYLRLKPPWSFISSLWEHNPTVQTCWVPWDWCSTVKQQTENNSIVIFSPRWDTVHGVRLRYDHLATQRTQFYGNLWYEQKDVIPDGPEFKDFDFVNRRFSSLSHRVSANVEKVRKAIKQGRSG